MARVATVVIDMLNPYDHEDAQALVEQVSRHRTRHAALKMMERNMSADLRAASDALA